MTITDTSNGTAPTWSGDLTPATPGTIAPDGGRKARRLAAEQAPRVPTEPADEREPKPPLSPARGTAAWVLACLCFLTLGFLAYAVLLTPFQEARTQTVLYDTFRQQLAAQTAPLGGAMAPGVPVALLSAPSLGIQDSVVVEGTASGDLMSGPGHRRDTVLPGQAGVSVLYGRATLFGGPFSALTAARAGDVITVTTGQGVFRYTVNGVRRVNDPLPAPLTAGGGRLTLATAVGTGRFGALTPEGVLYVDASLSGQGQPTLPGRPAAVPDAERAMQGDPSALLPLALALPLLIGALVFAVFAFNRWGGWQAWVVSVPLVLLGLWMTAQAAVQLLPNLL
jgi:sortase A